MNYASFWGLWKWRKSPLLSASLLIVGKIREFRYGKRIT